MSRSIWMQKRFTEVTVSEAVTLFHFAREKGVDFFHCIEFMCYVLERRRQNGRGGFSAAATWEAAARGKDRYRRGKNGLNYREGGRRLLSAAASVFGLLEGTPAEVIWDHLEDTCPDGLPAPTDDQRHTDQPEIPSPADYGFDDSSPVD